MSFRTMKWLILPLLFFWGCVIDQPQSPSFETNLFLPLGERKTTGLDLVHQSDYISGDTTGTDPLSFVLQGDLTEFRVGSALDVERPSAAFTSTLTSIQVDAPPSRRVELPLSSMQGAPAPDGAARAVTAFAFSAGPIAMEPMSTFEWVRLAAGRMEIHLRNGLPLSIGAWPDTAVVIRVNDAVTHQPVITFSTSQAIAANGAATLTADLSGVSFHHEIELVVRGMSPGSQGEAVVLNPSDAVLLDVSLSGLAADSAYAPVPAQTMSVTRGIPLAENVRLISADVLDGDLALTIRHALPLPATVTVTFPELMLGSGSFPPEVLRLPAGGQTVSDVRATISLAGAHVQAPGGNALGELHYRVDAVSQGTQDPVRVGIHQQTEGSFERGLIRFREIQGLMNARRVEIPPTEKAFDIPDGIDQLDFEDATLTLEVESSVGLSSRAAVELQAVSEVGSARTSMSMDFEVMKPPDHQVQHQVYDWNAGNSNILDIIRARPRALKISGSLEIGGPGELGTVRCEDSVRGHYTLMAPLRMRIGQVHYRADPFSFTISDDEQDQIRDHLGRGSVHGQVANHFPAGLTARIAFAGREEDLESHPDVVLDSVTAAAGQTDAQGRVSQATTTSFDLAISEEDVSFFARAKVYGQVVFRLSNDDPNRLVLLTALDYVTVNAMMEFRVRVKP